jgi:transcriptional regulator with XRE-family HTH domain
MKDQTDKIRQELLKAIRAEIATLEAQGLTRKQVAEKAGVQSSFLSNFMRSNNEHFDLGIPRIIKIASGLDLKIEMTIKGRDGSSH